jgi:hypothetical protein
VIERKGRRGNLKKKLDKEITSKVLRNAKCRQINEEENILYPFKINLKGAIGIELKNETFSERNC